jgi:YVTN family beta-propeller protein
MVRHAYGGNMRNTSRPWLGLMVATCLLVGAAPALGQALVRVGAPVYAYITHIADNFVTVVDGATFAEVARIPVGTSLANVAFRSDGRYAYVTIIGENKVVVIDTRSRTVVKKIPAGGQPWGLVVMSPPGP